MSKISRNRGCTIRISPEGYRVIMYVDTPGIYFDEKAVRVKPDIAAAAGFDVIEDRKSNAKIQLRKNYDRQIGAKFAAMEQAMDELLATNPNVLAEMEVKEVTKGRFGVVVGDVAITSTDLNQEEASTLYQALVGEDFTADAEEPPVLTNRFIDMDSKAIRAELREAEIEVPVGLRKVKLAQFAYENMPKEESKEDDNSSLL